MGTVKSTTQSSVMASNLSDKPLKERYIAAMVLAGVGDALGYKGGEWEFCHSGRMILEELRKLGGLQKIKVDTKHWCVSDDTVMHLATAEALVDQSSDDNKQKLYSLIAKYYKICMKDMSGRAPGATCMTYTHQLKPDAPYGYRIPFNSRGGGCGAAMRAMCIGLRYPRPEDLDDLIAVGIESGRMTHHHPTGYLGSMTAALFTAYSIQGKPPVEWGPELLKVLERAKTYIQNEGHYTKDNLAEWPYFESAWEDYVDKRQLRSGQAVFPPDYDTEERDKFYTKISYGGWGGASGHDSTIIAYDAILGAGKDWEELCKRGVFHGGDSDSTGTIAACCYGAMYGFDEVPKGNYEKLEYRNRMEGAGEELFRLAKDSQSRREAQESKNTGKPETQDQDEDDMDQTQPEDSKETGSSVETQSDPQAAFGDSEKAPKEKQHMEETPKDPKDVAASEKPKGESVADSEDDKPKEEGQETAAGHQYGTSSENPTATEDRQHDKSPSTDVQGGKSTAV